MKRSASRSARSSSERSRWGSPGALAPGLDARRGAVLRDQRGGGGQLADAAEERARGGHEAAGEVVVERGAVELGGSARPAWSSAPISEATAVRAPVAAPVERLDAELVAGGHEPLAALVPEREGEDAVQACARSRCRAPRRRAGSASQSEPVAKRWPRCSRLGAQRAVVVDLAVGDQRDLRRPRRRAAGRRRRRR